MEWLVFCSFATYFHNMTSCLLVMGLLNKLENKANSKNGFVRLVFENKAHRQSLAARGQCLVVLLDC
jgi:hypothetical protein